MMVLLVKSYQHTEVKVTSDTGRNLTICFQNSCKWYHLDNLFVNRVILF